MPKIVSKYMTKEQFEKAQATGIAMSTIIKRIKRGADPEDAITKEKQPREYRDWQNDIYALYIGTEYLTNGNIYEIQEDTGYPLKTLKGLVYKKNFNDKSCDEEYLKLIFLYKDEEENDYIAYE